MDAADDDNADTALYAPYQTSLYVAPPVVGGQIPKNVYGNLDVYVPSMVPPGGIHISHPETARAARVVGIDYADAVTGFSFKGRHGTAITSGAVVAVEYGEAVEQVIIAFEDERSQIEVERRSLAALKMWKRFLAGLRIRERIEGYEIEGVRDTAIEHEMDKAEDEDEDEDEDTGGGFLPDRDADGPAQPTAKAMPTRMLTNLANDDEDGGFLSGEDELEEMESPHTFDRFVNRVSDDDDDEGGGGFLPDENDTRDETPLADDSLKPSSSVRSILEDPGSIDPRDTPQNKEPFEEPLPDLPAGELEEARMLQQLYESQGSEHLPVSKEDFTASAPSKSPEPPPMRETTAGGEWGTSAHPSEVYPDNQLVTEEDVEPDSSEEDNGSLISHDPDDDDAYPEWMA